ncbi:hypothetical protein [Hydrogenophaga sp.]|uniref:hypothetical protein n=1 Tax=Hydrogenophaga sp. TaxID=1904254 RepID=UPI0035B071FD
MVTLNPGGTLSDIVLLQGRAGNPVTVADLLAANPQYTDVTRIPAGAELNVPMRRATPTRSSAAPTEMTGAFTSSARCTRARERWSPPARCGWTP